MADFMFNNLLPSARFAIAIAKPNASPPREKSKIAMMHDVSLLAYAAAVSGDITIIIHEVAVERLIIRQSLSLAIRFASTV